MRDIRVASRYAEALLGSARERGVVDGVAESYAGILEAVAGRQDLRVFIESPQVPTQDKKDLLQTVFGDHVEPVLLHFCFLLLDKNRIDNFRDIGEEYARLVETERGMIRARVVTAIALPADLEEKLAARLNDVTGKTVILEKRVDPAVIGGVKVTLGDKILDGTVRTNLDLLRKTLEKAPVRL
jgi:F-type H+-transporting ATPase subunit delta